MSVDTGFDLHVDLLVGGDGEVPHPRDKATMLVSLMRAAKDRNMEITEPCEKWFHVESGWMYSLGVNRREARAA